MGLIMSELEERKQKEIEHSDQRRSIVAGFEYQTDASDDSLKRDHVVTDEEYEHHFSNMKFYSITRSSFNYRDSLLYDKITGATTLDYCCGNGEVALEMARKDAGKVCAIDISQVAIDNAMVLAEKYGVAERCEFSVMDAEDMTYATDSFDIIHEYGALHHLELDAAFKELSRVLKPDGVLVCTEALRHNPLIHRYRKRTPQLRTDWEVEHILGVPEIQQGRKYFSEVKIRFFHLAALGAVPFRKSFFFRPLLKVLEGCDNILMRIPYLRRMAWIAVIEYRKPKK